MIKIMVINRKIKQLFAVVLGLIFFGSCKENIDYINPTWARAVFPDEGATVKIDFFEPDQTQVFRWETRANRSEEHTSELQSRENLVCRLLLEKKKHTPRE